MGMQNRLRLVELMEGMKTHFTRLIHIPDGAKASLALFASACVFLWGFDCRINISFL